MPTDERAERPPDPVEDETGGPEAPNEGSPGHHPDDEDAGREDEEAAESFPASDPPANY
jgi:hypothetical protein